MTAIVALLVSGTGRRWMDCERARDKTANQMSQSVMVEVSKVMQWGVPESGESRHYCDENLVEGQTLPAGTTE